MRPTATALALLLLVSAGTCLGTGHHSNTVMKVEGFLADIYCIKSGKAKDGANMITNPEDHSAHCAALTVCVPDGYTILTAPTSGQTTYGKMYNLTAAGNTAAYDYLKALDGSTKNLLVTMNGKMDSTDKFEIVGDSSNTFGDMTSGSASTTSGAAQSLLSFLSKALVAFLVLLF